MTGTGRCDNPMCSCDPCTCSDCGCGGARLGDVEHRVMNVLWESSGSELTVRDVANRLPGNAYTTTATVLDRLVHKGLLQRRMAGRSIRFSAVGTPGAYAALLMRQTLAGAGEPESTLTYFAQLLAPSEAAVLRDALDRIAAAASAPTT